MSPADLLRNHAGLAEQRLLGVGQGIGILDADAERIKRLQRIGDVLQRLLRYLEAELEHRGGLQRLWWPSHSSR